MRFLSGGRGFFGMLDLLKFSLGYWKYPNLEKVAIIGVQHIMESILELFRSLKYCGLKPENTFLLGKCYSTSKSIYKNFLDEGFNVLADSTSFNSHQSFDFAHKKNIKKLLKFTLAQIELGDIEKLVVLDDGGELISLLNDLDIDKSKIFCVEQTSSGFNKVKDLDLNIPVINVARSTAKLNYETPFIIESALKRLNFHIPMDQIREANILILGHGSIGKHLEQYLDNAFDGKAKVKTFDSRFQHKHHLPNLLKDAEIILGTSGEISLPYSFYRYLEKENVFLASISSSDREFEAWKVRKQSPKTTNAWKNCKYSNITLIQSGFPINFWGDPNNMDLNYIQITLSLLQGAILQGITDKNSSNILHQLDSNFQKGVINEFKKSLLQMNFSKTQKKHLKKFLVG